MRFTAEEKYVKVLGRTLFKDGTRYMNFSCSAVEFLFTGSRAEAVIWSNSASVDEKHTAWAAVFVNDEETPSKRFPLKSPEDTYVLYEGEWAENINIRLVKYSEVTSAKIGIRFIITDSDIPPVPTAYKKRKLEFIGDSMTCGYGNEGILNVDNFKTSQENPWQAYAARTARALDADYHLISMSGIGVYSSWTDKDEPLDSWLMPHFYPYTDKTTETVLGASSFEKWNTGRFSPDCIIINLGTNDFSYTKNKPERIKAFGDHYLDFVRTVRAMNPKAMILCTLGIMGQDLFPEIEDKVRMLKSEGDERIQSMLFDVQVPEDGYGADCHPTLITHAKAAQKLEARLRALLNW